RDSRGRVRARLLDLVPGRTGKAYADWLTERSEQFRDGVQVATLDPFRGYANAIDGELGDAVPVRDAFHVVKLGTQVTDEVRRRVQQDTLGHRGHAGDPLFRIRNLLRRGAEQVLATFSARPVPEIARLGRTLRQWKDTYLGYFTTDRSSNGGTEAINGIIELHRRLARGYRNRDNYRLLLAASGTRPWRANHA
ncbi:MAG TPA: transposase, partial [Propionibacteriaceae bacterium]